jgi:hypothetical protein
MQVMGQSPEPALMPGYRGISQGLYSVVFVVNAGPSCPWPIGTSRRSPATRNDDRGPIAAQEAATKESIP